MNILVISDDENSNIIKFIYRNKLMPIIRRSILPALELIRHQDVSAIIVDKNHQHIDTLEFILNVRDINKNIPIIVQEDSIVPGDKEVTRSMKNVIIDDQCFEWFKKQLNNITKHKN